MATRGLRDGGSPVRGAAAAGLVAPSKMMTVVGAAVLMAVGGPLARGEAKESVGVTDRRTQAARIELITAAVRIELITFCQSW